MKENKGITLVALIITIIVMLILVAVSVRLVINSNILATAKKAGEDYEKEQAKESNLTMGEIVEEYVPTTPTITPIPATEYIGYYADFEGDGTIDGIIYADLAVEKEETIWCEYDGTFDDEDDMDWLYYSGIYGYEAKSNLKSYYIKVETYNGEQVQAIVPIKGTTGNDRFYVMALEDIKATIDGTEHTTFCWYNNAPGKLNNTYSVAYTYNDFGAGKSNTIRMIDAWNNETYEAQHERDLWGVIQNRQDYEIVENETDSGKWFVPSKAEWSAYAGNLGIDTENYAKKGLGAKYWSSSYFDNRSALSAYFPWCTIDEYPVTCEYEGFCCLARLSATF